MVLVPHREPGIDARALPADYQAIMKIVAAVPKPAKDVTIQLGRGSGPA
jgi:hypothetical protein